METNFDIKKDKRHRFWGKSRNRYITRGDTYVLFVSHHERIGNDKYLHRCARFYCVVGDNIGDIGNAPYGYDNG